MSTEPQEYIDELTGIRLTVEYDIPEHPKLTVYPDWYKYPEGANWFEQLNEAVRRLLAQAGIEPVKLNAWKCPSTRRTDG